MSEIKTAIEKARELQQGQIILTAIPYAKNIGLEAMNIGEQQIFKLPMRESNQGNPFLPAIHGGVTGGAMELAAAVYVLLHTQGNQIPKVVDFSIDYLRPGLMQDTFIECEMVRQGRKIANVNITAWQTLKTKAIATARAHFILPEQ